MTASGTGPYEPSLVDLLDAANKITESVDDAAIRMERVRMLMERPDGPRCDGCEAEGFRTRYCPDHTTNFCDGCWERNGCPHPVAKDAT